VQGAGLRRISLFSHDLLDVGRGMYSSPVVIAPMALLAVSVHRNPLDGERPRYASAHVPTFIRDQNIGEVVWILALLATCECHVKLVMVPQGWSS
jgi:hypothetical protein